MVAAQLIDGVGLKHSLRDNEPRRVQEVAIVDREFAADWGLEPEAQADRVGPDCTKIGCVDIIRIRVGRIENFPRILEHVSAVVEGNGAEQLR